MFEIEDLFELSLDGAFQSLEEFKDFANSADDETLFSVITPGAFKDLEEFKLSLVEKKNPIVTPSDGEEVLTESTTETEVQDGVSDSLEVNEVVEEGVINESQLNFGDQTGPIVEEEKEVLIPDAPNRKGVLKNKDGSVSTHKMKTETDGEGNWFSFPTVFQNEDGEFVDMSEGAEIDWKPVYEEAKKRGEIIDFGKDKESALAYGKGSWKNQFSAKEVDVVEEEDSFGEYIGKGLDVGVSTVSKSIYDLPSLIYDAAATLTNPIARALGIEEASSEKFAKTFNLKNIPSEIVGKRIAEKQKEIQEYNDANGGDALAAIEDGNILGAAKMIAGTTAQSIPLMIPAFFSGGSSVGLGIVGASTASTKAATLKEDNPDMDVSSRTINAVTTGILEATLGQLLTGASGNVTKKILSTEGSKKGAKIISDSFKEMLESSIEKSPILPLFGEMLEEGLVSVGEQLTDISTGVKTDFSMREVINSGISAVGMGGANTVSVYGSKAYVSSKEYRKLKQVNKKLSKLSDEVSSNLDLSDDEKTILNKSIDRLKAKANGIVDKANDKVSLLPNDVKQELDNTLLNLDEISVAAFRINSNKDTPIEIKEVLLNELKAQAIELTDKKNKILSAEYILNEFEKLPDNEKASLKEQATEILLKEAKDAGQTEINITENQIADKANELLKQNQDAIQEPSTEKQVLPNEETSGVDGSIPEVGLQQVGEGNVEQDTTGTKIEEGDTQTDQVTDTTTETDAEQLEKRKEIESALKAKRDKDLSNVEDIVTESRESKSKANKNNDKKVVGLNSPFENGKFNADEDISDGLFIATEGGQIIPNPNVSEFKLKVAMNSIDSNFTDSGVWETTNSSSNDTKGVKVIRPAKYKVVKNPDGSKDVVVTEKGLIEYTTNESIALDKSAQRLQVKSTSSSTTKNTAAIKEINETYEKELAALNQRFKTKTTETDTQPASTEEGMSVNKERVDSIVDGIVEKTKKRGVGKDTNPQKIADNAISYLKGSKLFEESTDIERENILRDVSSKLGVEIKPPTAKKLLGIKRLGKPKTITVKSDYAAMKKDLQKEAKVARDAKNDVNKRRKGLQGAIDLVLKAGNITTKKANTLLKKVSNVNLYNAKKVQDVIDFTTRAMNDAEYSNKLDKAKRIQKSIKTKLKGKEAGLSDSAKKFTEVNPSNVSDIDSYLEKAEAVSKGLQPTRKPSKGNLKVSKPFDTKKTDEYSNKEKDLEVERNYELSKESFQELTGLEPGDLTLEEMRDLLIALDGDTLTEEGKSKAVNEKKDAVEKALKQAISNAKINVKQVIADSDVEVSKQDKKLLSEFLKMDMNVLTTEQKMKALDAILIFETNQSTGGMKSILKQAEGKKGMISLAKQKIITSAKSWMVGRYWNKSISTLPNVFELMFGSPQKGAIAMKNMGVTEAVNGAAKAERQSEDILTDYGNSFNKKKMKSGIYFDESNDIERGILGEIQRFTPGQEVKDFTDSKNLIEETYENLLKSTNKENIAKGEIIKEAYDRLVKDSNNISEVQSKADPANLEGVKYLTDVWASNYESLAEVSLNVYNKNLGKDTNYIPRSIQNISVEKSPDRDITQPLFNPDGTSSVYSKKTGVLEEATKPGKFKNSNKILNLGFDSQNMANLKAALTDVNTAAAIQKIKGAITSDAFEQVFPNDQSRQIVKDRIIKYIDAKRAGEKINEDDKKLLKILNKGATFGVVKALGGLTQPFKQLVPIFNTAINAGPINTTKASALIFNKDVQDAINNSGLGIANRGASSQGDISGVDSRIKQAAKTKGGKIVDAIDKLNKDVIDVFLVKTDVQTARASFIAYYLKAMDKKGVKSGDIDFTKPLDKEASQYAQQQVDRQQNTSDSDLQGDLFTGKGLGVQVLRKTLFPFANFLLNQKTRMYSDINTLTRKRKTALPGDKTAAAKSLAGLATETAIFNAIGLGITQMLSNVARMYTGEEEEGAEEKKQKEFDSRLAGRIGNVVADVLVPIPALNSLALSQANSLLSIMQEGDDNPFKFFAKTDKDLIDQLGVFGIGIKKATILKDMIMTIQSGEITSENFGKKSSKKLTPEAIDNLKGVASAYALHLVGMLPFSEVGYLSERAYKNISKMKLDESPMILSAPKKKKTMKNKSTSFSKPTSFGSGKKKKSFSPKSFGN